MDYIEKTGKTVEEAIDAALAELGVSAAEADITVVDQGKPGFFLGLGSKPAVVRAAVRGAQGPAEEHKVTQVCTNCATEAAVVAAQIVEGTEKIMEAPAEKKEAKKYVVNDEAVAKAREFLQEIFTAMKVDVVMEKFINSNDGSVTFRLHGDDMGILIGKHGQTLDSLQYLTNLAANKVSTDRVRVIIDVEDYRDRRVETLTRLARRLADKVRREGEPIALEAMNPHERKIIHMALQNDRKVTTVSEGEDPNRHIIIKLKK